MSDKVNHKKLGFRNAIDGAQRWLSGPEFKDFCEQMILEFNARLVAYEDELARIAAIPPVEQTDWDEDRPGRRSVLGDLPD